MLRKKEAEEELRRVQHAGILNIQSLAVKLPPHSPSSLECEEGKEYNEKMQFVLSIIPDIYESETSIVEFLHKRKKGWSSNEQAGPENYIRGFGVH